MSFTLGFYSFSLEITDSERALYAKTRVKIPRHPQESLQHLYARILTFAHCYEENLQLAGSMFEPKEPSAWVRDGLGEVSLWIEIGCPDHKKIERALKHHRKAQFRIYFWQHDQISRFCHYLRGSHTNWVDSIRFFTLSEDFLGQLSEQEKSSSQWRLSFADDVCYLSRDEVDFETKIQTISIWDEFQKSIQKGPI